MRVKDVARATGKSEQVIRLCLQQGLLPFGTAIKMPGSQQFTYIIYPEKFKDYIGQKK